ncbi:hypothetical protein Emed_004352 [Eimeria media]
MLSPRCVSPRIDSYQTRVFGVHHHRYAGRGRSSASHVHQPCAPYHSGRSREFPLYPDARPFHPRPPPVNGFPGRASPSIASSAGAGRAATRASRLVAMASAHLRPPAALEHGTAQSRRFASVLQAVEQAIQALGRPADALHIIMRQLHRSLPTHIPTCMTTQLDPTRIVANSAASMALWAMTPSCVSSVQASRRSRAAKMSQHGVVSPNA